MIRLSQLHKKIHYFDFIESGRLKVIFKRFSFFVFLVF
ncbi:MAG: hypothetical protein ACJA1B_003038, partial [Polaribacter sp.]